MDNTKSSEIQKTDQTQQPQYCKSQCGFFGSSDKQGYCSLCFKKEMEKVEKQEKKQQDQLKPKIENSRTSSTESDQKVTLAMADLMKPGSSVAAEPQTPQKSDDATPVAAEAPSTPKVADSSTASPPNDEESTPPAKKAKKRCGVCRKKLGLTGFECRCGLYFCGIHRYSDKHDCPFDYKKTGRAELSAANPLVAGEKIKKL